MLDQRLIADVLPQPQAAQKIVIVIGMRIFEGRFLNIGFYQGRALLHGFQVCSLARNDTVSGDDRMPRTQPLDWRRQG